MNIRLIIVRLSESSAKNNYMFYILPTYMGIDIDKELARIKEQVNAVKAKYPDFSVYITVSKSFNDLLAKHLGTEDYSIRLEELYGCKYQVSPFVDRYYWIVGLFDYSQILWQWNTFQDKMYNIGHLFTYVTDEDAKKEDGEEITS